MAFLFDVELRYVFGRYDPKTNILYTGCPNATDFVEEKDVRALFAEVVTILKRCPKPPTLFVDFGNIRIDPTMATVYRESLEMIRPLLLVTYRYNIARDVHGTLTSTVIRTQNMKAHTSGNVYPTLEAALKAHAGALTKATSRPSSG